MREESNRVSCSSRDGNGQDRWRWWLLFCGPGVTDTTAVTYVVVTGTRQLGDLLAEEEREVKDKAYIACR